MKRLFKLLTFLLLLAILFSFAGCDQEPISTDAPTEAPTEKPTEKPTEALTEKSTEDLSNKLNIGSYNIANGRNVGHAFTLIANDIRRNELDIVGLQEVDQFTNRAGGQDTMKSLSKSSKLEYYAYFKAMDFDGGEYGLGILSRYPIISTETIRLDSGEHEPRILAKAVIDVNGTQISFFVTHLSYEDMTLNAAQTETVIGELNKASGNFILTGDFNTSDFTAYENAGFGAVNNSSYRVPTFDNSYIDNIIYSKEFYELSTPSILANGHSDHNMLYATATLK
jgi:endonuclease/exonuclease/phosphatase family metal-dependent hydrolase